MYKLLRNNFSQTFNKSLKHQLSYFERENIRRKFDQEKMVKANFNFRKVVGTGFDLNSVDCYEFTNAETKEGKNLVANSYIKVVLPFETNADLVLLVRHYLLNKMRIGKLLEIMDFIAGRVCYRHLAVLGDHKFTCVTACIDNFQVFEDNYSLDENIFIEAYLSYVGSRTMEVQVDVLSTSNKLLMSVNFLFVAKSNDPTEKRVPALDLENDENPDKAHLLYEMGKVNQDKRITEAKTSSFKIPPSPSEMQELHEIWLGDDSQGNRISMADTIQKKTELKHLSDRNVHGTVFGGTLMRESFELAFVTADLIAPKGNSPHLVHISDTQFYKPVHAGNIVNYESVVNYIQGNNVSVNVTIDVLDKDEKGIKAERTNEFNVIFDIGKSVGKIVPQSYKEAMQYIQGKRKLMNLLSHKD